MSAADIIDAVGAIVILPGAPWRVLLIRRGRPPNEGSWTLPGGHVEAGESREDATRREVLEETSMVVRVVAFLEIFELRTPARTYAIHEHVCALAGNGDATEQAAALRPGDDAAEAFWATEEDLDARGVAGEARGVIARAVALARDKKVL